MATKRGAFEESTKVHSSSELDDILRKARTQPSRSLDEDDYDDFEERTIVGPAQELAAKSLTTPDPDQPIAARPSTKNVVRRTGPVEIPRASGAMPAVRAAGSASELAVPPVKTDDDAFEPWDDFDGPGDKAPVAAAEPEREPVDEAAPSSVVVTEAEASPSIVVEEAPQPVAAPITMPARKGMRWGVVAWFVLLVAMLGSGGFAYWKILELQHELALTRSALEAEKLR